MGNLSVELKNFLNKSFVTIQSIPYYSCLELNNYSKGYISTDGKIESVKSLTLDMEKSILNFHFEYLTPSLCIPPGQTRFLRYKIEKRRGSGLGPVKKITSGALSELRFPSCSKEKNTRSEVICFQAELYS